MFFIFPSVCPFRTCQHRKDSNTARNIILAVFSAHPNSLGFSQTLQILILNKN